MPEDRTAPLDWPALAQEQLAFHWEVHIRPRLEGLTDDELHWEPVPECWGVRPRADATSPQAAGAGSGYEGRAHLEAEVRRLEDLGARVLDRHDDIDGRWVTMADPEGNELCLI